MWETNEKYCLLVQSTIKQVPTQNITNVTVLLYYNTNIYSYLSLFFSIMIRSSTYYIIQIQTKQTSFWGHLFFTCNPSKETLRNVLFVLNLSLISALIGGGRGREFIDINQDIIRKVAKEHKHWCVLELLKHWAL